MSNQRRYASLVQSHRYAHSETDKFVKKRLARQACHIRMVLHKKVSWDRRAKYTPPQFGWVDYYESLHIVQLGEDHIEFYIEKNSLEGRAEVQYYTVPVEWLYLSDWAMGAVVRKAVREYKNSGKTRELEQAKLEYQRLQKVLSQQERVYREARRLFHAQYDRVEKLRKDLIQN